MERGIKKLNFLLYCSLLISILGGLGGNTGCRKVEECISLEGAREVVLYQVVGIDTVEWDPTKIRVYELPYMLEKGDTVKGYRDSIYITKAKCWFFFIDDEPRGKWAHPCRYVFVYCIKNYEIIHEQWRPYLYLEGRVIKMNLIEIKW
jgi:hypothetical protein